MKVCFFIGFYPEIIGGAEYQSRLIADEISKNNEVFFVSYGHKNDSVEQIDGYKVYKVAISNPRFDKLTLYYFFLKKVKIILDRERPDLLYQRVLNAFSHYLSNYCYINKIPFVIHIADDRSISFEYKKVIDLIRYFFFKRLVKYSPKFICQTQEQISLLKKHCNYDAVLVNNMHPIDRHSTKLNIGSKNKVTWVANVRGFKQPELFIELAKDMQDANELEFHMVGLIPESKYGSLLKDRIRNTSNLIYHGQKNNDFINDLLAESLVLVNTSSYEGFSNVFIQAWLANIPVYSLNVNPNLILIDETMGICFKGDIKRMQKSILEYFESNKNNNPPTIYIREKAIDLFSIDKNVEIISGLFDKLVFETNNKKQSYES